MSEKLIDYSTGKPFPGTESWVEVAQLGDGGGYDWCDFNAFYSPSARRYFWHGDRGCSCNSWQDELETSASFEDGDRAALIRAWETFVMDNEYSFGAADYINGVAAIKNFKEPK